jgi:DNA ligase D-like protein (predicted 3'-phosphoesterase)
MARPSSLKKYRKKRNFGSTPEPSGAQASRGREPRFVAQKHNATKLHYDFRLEAGGVLKSWAIPKGPSTDPRQKRLAKQTEDHPLDYADFEGVIPEKEYGGGAVLVWDRGTYRNTTDHDGKRIPIKKALDGGHATFVLKGKKLTGGYALTRTGKAASGRWLLVKMKDGAADARRNPVSTQPESVLTKRTLKQVAREKGKR